MKPIDRSEVLGLAEYEAVREPFRDRVIAEKKLRRLRLGPNVTALFENRDTVLLQIQEMLRTERITRPQAVAHEIATYNEQIPGDEELSCTLMIDVEDHDARESFLRAAVGFERHVWLVALATAAHRVQARALARDGDATDRTTAVHYVKFPLPPDVVAALKAPAAGRSPLALALEVDHPAYAARAALSAEAVASLAGDD